MASVSDGGDQAFCVGEWSTANRVEAIGQSLHNQPVLTLAERMSINMFVLTLAYRVEIRFSSAEASAPSLFVCRLDVREKTFNFQLQLTAVLIDCQ